MSPSLGIDANAVSPSILANGRFPDTTVPIITASIRSSRNCYDDFDALVARALPAGLKMTTDLVFAYTWISARLVRDQPREQG